VKASLNTANLVRTDGCGLDSTGSRYGQVAASRERVVILFWVQ